MIAEVDVARDAVNRLTYLLELLIVELVEELAREDLVHQRVTRENKINKTEKS